MEANDPGNGFSAFGALRALKRRKLYVLVPALLATAAAVVYTRRMPEHFRAQALIVAEPVAHGDYLNDRPGDATAANVQDQLRTIRETLFSRPVLETVNSELHLSSQGTGTPEQALEALKSKIQIQVEAPDAFQISFEGQQPRQVMQATNRLAELFIERASDLRGEHAQQVDSFLDSEVNRLQGQLRDQEDSLKAYKESMAQVLPERLATNLKILEDLQQQVRSKTDQITEGQARQLAANEEMKSLEQQGALRAEPQEKTAAEGHLDDLRLKLSQLKAQYTAKNPEIARTEKEIHDLEASAVPAGNRPEPSAIHLRYIALQAEVESINQRLQSYQQERSALASQVEAAERKVDSSPGLETTLADRVRDAGLTRQQYEAMLAKQQAAKLDQRAETSTKAVAYKIAEPAQLPTAPSGPQPNKIILMGLAAGLGLGLALVLAMEQMDTTFDSIEELQGFTNLAVLSAVPTIPKRAGRNYSARRTTSQKGEDEGIDPARLRQYQENRLAVLGDPQSIPSEQYGILAMKVEQWMEKSGGKVLVVTSAAGGEGKSVTSLNLGLALSASLKGRVLLVDSDLRRPRVHECLGLTTTKGFAELLAQTGDEIGPYISKLGSLDVIVGGAPPVNPLGLLASPQARELLARLRKEYALIVVDSPPIVPIADSHILAGMADGVVIVVRARQTRRELFRRAIQSLGAANVLGVVLNDVEYGDTRYAYAFRNYQRHYLRRG